MNANRTLWALEVHSLEQGLTFLKFDHACAVHLKSSAKTRILTSYEEKQIPASIHTLVHSPFCRPHFPLHVYDN